MKTAYFWVTYGGERAVFFYSKSRGKAVIADALSKGCKKFRAPPVIPKFQQGMDFDQMHQYGT